MVSSLPLSLAVSDTGKREVMLLSSRETGRWVIPKGWPIKGRKPAEVAQQEAYEEAELVGHIGSKRPLGHFHYLKRLPKGDVICRFESSYCASNDSLMSGRRKSSEKPNGLMRRRLLNLSKKAALPKS